jgi:hypothetical protein
VLDHPEHANHSISQTLEHSTEPLDAIGTDPALATRLSKTSPTTHVLDRSEPVNHGSSKALNTQSGKAMEMSPREAHIESLPMIGKLSQPGKSVTPTLWLAFALSSIALLMGTVMLYAIVPLRSLPVTNKSIKSRPPIITPTHQAIYTTPTIQPIVQQQQATPAVQPKKQALANKPSAAPTLAAPPVQASLTGNYAQQNQAHSLTNEGTLDWINWGINTPQDVNHKANVQRQINNFTVIGNCTVQRDSYYANSNIEWFDGIPQPDTASSQTWGVYVTGIHNGFSITVPASTTPRTLRVYVGAKLAQGEFTASLDDKIYRDATLDMTHDPNSTQANSIYTVVFNGNAANQALTVTYTAMATNGSNSYVMLQAATLQ